MCATILAMGSSPPTAPFSATIKSTATERPACAAAAFTSRANHGRIAGNHVSTNRKDGILLDNTAFPNNGPTNTTGNLVFGNTARNNADFQLRIQGLVPAGLNADNQVGPLQTLNTATSPFANFQ